MISDEPAPATVAVDPDSETTDGEAETYDQAPATEAATVGALNEKSALPNVFDTFDHVNVGVALSTIKVALVVPTANFPVSVGVNVAVTNDDPAVNTVTRLPATVATEVASDA